MWIREQALQPIDSPAWQSVVNVPARRSARVRIGFDDTIGKTVYHGDSGMMGLIEARWHSTVAANKSIIITNEGVIP